MSKMTHKEKDELIVQMKEEIINLRKKIKREEKTLPKDSKLVALSCLQDPKTRNYYVYEIAFNPTDDNIIERHVFSKAPHLADFKAKKILHEKLLPQEIKGE